ncbi:MAG: Methyltransferase, cyclopropane fatty acid synthase [Candidatus Kaiserbacteria bacterium]|nr:Methyltransferase, cyclopropane fatty acid synthase [Candidatus Kaiserbacteria bacterium]
MKRYFIRNHFASLARSDSKFPIKVVFANGSVYQNLDGEAEIIVRFNTNKGEWRTIVLDYIGFIEAYRLGEIDIEGKGGSVEALRKLTRMSYELIEDPLVDGLGPVSWLLKLIQEYRLNNRSYLTEKKNLYAHYNMPAEFFHYMNGELYGYTEGYYETGKESQNEAQFKKYDYICRRLRLKPGDKVVEVGSAWGTMALMMAKKYGANVVNYGLVDEQNRIMGERIIKMGLQDKIKIEQRDCRELGHEKERYDKYVSLGVLEHAGKDCVEDWIRNIAEALKPGGIGVLTNVGYMSRHYDDYLIGKYIWRGCYFPKMGDVLQYLEKYDLHLVDLEDTHLLYADTMEVMLAKMYEHWDKIQLINPRIFDDKFKRIWTVYYIGAIEAFRSKKS